MAEMFARIKGQIGTIDEPGEPDHGLWVYTIWLVGPNGEAIPNFDEITRGPFKTEATALRELHEHVRSVTSKMEQNIKGLSFEHMKKPIEEYDA